MPIRHQGEKKENFKNVCHLMDETKQSCREFIHVPSMESQRMIQKKLEQNKSEISGKQEQTFRRTYMYELSYLNGTAHVSKKKKKRNMNKAF